MDRATITKSEQAGKWTRRIREEYLAEGAPSQGEAQRSLSEERLMWFKRKDSLVEASVDVVIRKYGKYLHSRALKLLGACEAAEEVLQETWIDLYMESIAKGRGWLYNSERYAWLTQVLYHNVCDYLRRQRRQSKIISLDTEEGIWLLEQRTDPFDRPDVSFMRDELAVELYYMMLRTLTSSQLRSLTCFYWREYSIKEIAELLCCPENTVKSHLRRAREELRKAFEEQNIHLKDIRAIGGLRERLDQVLSLIAANEIPTGAQDKPLAQALTKALNREIH